MEIPIGEQIKEIRYTSYFFDGEMKNEIINVYLEFENKKWYKITISDGKSEIELVDEPILSDNKNTEQMCYPIRRMEKIDLQKLGKLLKVNEYLWKGLSDESIGYIFNFNNSNLSVLEEEDQISLHVDIDHEKLENYKIKEKKLLDT